MMILNIFFRNRKENKLFIGKFVRKEVGKRSLMKQDFRSIRSLEQTKYTRKTAISDTNGI